VHMQKMLIDQLNNRYKNMNEDAREGWYIESSVVASYAVGGFMLLAPRHHYPSPHRPHLHPHSHSRT
jgi:hypothetical protein